MPRYLPAVRPVTSSELMEISTTRSLGEIILDRAWLRSHRIGAIVNGKIQLTMSSAERRRFRRRMRTQRH